MPQQLQQQPLYRNRLQELIASLQPPEPKIEPQPSAGEQMQRRFGGGPSVLDGPEAIAFRAWSGQDPAFVPALGGMVSRSKDTIRRAIQDAQEVFPPAIRERISRFIYSPSGARDTVKLRERLVDRILNDHPRELDASKDIIHEALGPEFPVWRGVMNPRRRIPPGMDAEARAYYVPPQGHLPSIASPLARESRSFSLSPDEARRFSPVYMASLSGAERAKPELHGRALVDALLFPGSPTEMELVLDPSKIKQLVFRLMSQR